MLSSCQSGAITDSFVSPINTSIISGHCSSPVLTKPSNRFICFKSLGSIDTSISLSVQQSSLVDVFLSDSGALARELRGCGAGLSYVLERAAKEGVTILFVHQKLSDAARFYIASTGFIIVSSMNRFLRCISL